MKTPGLTLKIAALANAILLTIAFVACPACKSRSEVTPRMMPMPIATPPQDHQRFIGPTIAPWPVDFGKVLPQDESKKGR